MVTTQQALIRIKITQVTMSYKLHKQVTNFEDLKVAHKQFTWSGGKIPQIGRYGGHNWQTLVFGSWMHE